MLPIASKSIYMLLFLCISHAQPATMDAPIDEEKEDPIHIKIRSSLSDPKDVDLSADSTPENTQQQHSNNKQPWRLYSLLNVDWLRFELEQRTRFEHLANDFRANHAGDATGLLLRTLLTAQGIFTPFQLFTEIIDARVYASKDAPLRRSFVDPIDILQAYVGLQSQHLFLAGDKTSIVAGRMTLNLGSRRLVARNGFRNTISSFSGIDLQWTSPNKDWLQLFVGFPTIRRPTETQAQRLNQIVFNTENFHALLWVVFMQNQQWLQLLTWEIYLVGLHEQHNTLAPSFQRQIYTPGMRWFKVTSPGAFGYEVEIMGQFGRSGVDLLATKQPTLRHLAFAAHVSFGYQMNSWGVPRMMILYDYASGGRSLQQGFNNRFDSLYGARRFDFGPTSFYGTIARSNTNTPGIRLELHPDKKIDIMTTYRLVWLASNRDSWTTANIQDPTGQSGFFVGQQIELRMRWHLLVENLSFDVGGAMFFRGRFALVAPNSRSTTPMFIYAQFIARI